VSGLADPPATAAWRLEGERVGVEAVSFARRGRGWFAAGSSTAVEAGTAWWVAYDIELDADWRTRRAMVSARYGAAAVRAVRIQGDGEGHWAIDGRPVPALDGCYDVDLESSALTNALPLRRLELEPGTTASVPAVYVRAQGLSVERLEQDYTRRPADAAVAEPAGPSVDYVARAFDFAARIDYDAAGLVVRYPGIAQRLG
jgi:uncharacterized protein